MTTYIQPLPKGSYWISQVFGSNPSNGNNPRGGHTGTDYAAAEGTPVYAIADGVVETAGRLTGTYRNNAHWLVPEFAGNHVVIDHGAGRPDAVYGHLLTVLVGKGQRVTQGQTIGYVGKTGKATGNHLHFEILPPGYVLDTPTYGRVNPALYVTEHKADSVVTRKVTNKVAYARTAPRSNAPLAPEYPEGIAQGANVAVIGYVAGEDPYKKGDNAWYKTPRGYFIWANAAGNNLGGLSLV